MEELKVLYYDQGAVEDEAALEYINSLIGSGSVDLHLLHVAEKPAEVRDEKRRDLAREQRTQKDLSGAPEAFEKAKGILNAKNLEITTISLEGDPVKEVNAILKNGGFDLLGVSAFGRGGFSKDVLGAHAKHLVQQSELPVLVHKGRLKACERVLIHIPTNKERCLEFVRYMARLLRGSHPAITLLSILVDEHQRFEGYTSAEEERLSEAVGDYDREELQYLATAQEILEKEGFESEIRHRRGNLTAELLNEAREGRYDLLAFAPQEPGFLLSLWQGDESFEVMRDIEISALKFPSKEKKGSNDN